MLFAAVAAVTLAFYFLVGERQVGATSPLTVAFWTMTFATAFWAFFSGWWDLRPETFSAPVQVGGAVGDLQLPLLIPLIITVVLGSFAPFLLSFYALKHLPATVAGIVASAEVVFAFVVAWLWLGEQLDVLQVAGAAVVLVGIVLAQTARSTKTVVDADLAIRTGAFRCPSGYAARPTRPPKCQWSNVCSNHGPARAPRTASAPRDAARTRHRAATRRPVARRP